jgi:hypothetical protein
MDGGIRQKWRVLITDEDTTFDRMRAKEQLDFPATLTSLHVQITNPFSMAHSTR